MTDIHIRIPQALLDEILSDLRRPHDYAYERVGFCYGKSQLTTLGWVVILNQYIPVSDSKYIKTKEVGARINSKAITEAFQNAYTSEYSLFHIHLHDFSTGLPQFSYDDMHSGSELISSIQDFVESQVHGMIVLSSDSFNAMALLPGDTELQPVQKISSVGARLNISLPAMKKSKRSTNRYSRQSFLGDNSENLIENIRIGIVGLSGGGSHIAQQTAHIGFVNYVLSDPECIDDESNLNRIVGATLQDATDKVPKFTVFQRLIVGLHPHASIGGGQQKWEDLLEQFKGCDIIFGCLDTVLGRRDLENFCRRYLIPLIDIGMGIETTNYPYAMFGQVQLSSPSHPCFRCNGFITEQSLKLEANNYGQKTKRPQVVWPNGILASTAVGILMNMITGWAGINEEAEYLSYDGNDHTISQHISKEYRPKICSHFLLTDTGPLMGFE